MQKENQVKMASTIERLVSEGNIKAATRMVTELGSSRPIPLSQVQPDGRTTKEHLQDKHPDPNPISSEALYDGPIRSSLNHPVVFTAITAETIRQTIQQMSGTAGPSGLDVSSWKRLCYSFNQASNDLCEAVAQLCRRLCTEFVDPGGIEAPVSCRLIALDKCPGIRPIGVGECLRRLVGRAVIQCIKTDLLCAIGNQQLCTSHIAGCEAAFHTLTNVLNNDDCEAILFIDASNAFNSINCQVTMQNIQRIFPLLAPIIINIYRMPSNLFIEGESIMSCEGVTQGDPLPMAFYALATIPLIEKLKQL